MVQSGHPHKDIVLPPQRATVRVPATSANLGPGFDSLGMALDLWAEVTVEACAAPPPPDPLSAMIEKAARALYEAAGAQPPAGLTAVWAGGDVPVARGLGASAAARVGGLMAANALLGAPLSAEEMLPLAARLEGHADNAAPALFGGLQVVVTDGGRLVHLAATMPAGLKAVLLVPEMAMPTDESRRLLPRQLSREDAIHNIGRAALLVAALSEGRFDLLDVATQDRLHQPARAQLFPAMEDVFRAAREAGALCAYLSGGGSTILALTREDENKIARAMKEAARARGFEAESLVTVPSTKGAHLVAPSVTGD
jgi:homoserine kinase